MATYTVLVKTVCESVAGNVSSNYTDFNKTIETAAPLIFNFNYPIWEESYRSILEQKIIKHYYMYEIGMETVGLWQFYLQKTMQEIMPYYVKLWETTQLDYDPLTNYKETITHKGEGTNNVVDKLDSTTGGTSTSSRTEDKNVSEIYDRSHEETTTGEKHESGTVESNTDTSGKTVSKIIDDLDENYSRAYSDTPQNSISRVENLEYLTNYTNDITKRIGDKEETRTDSGDSSTSGTDSRDWTESGTRKFGFEDNRNLSDKTTGSESGTTSGTRNDNRTTNANSTDDWIEQRIGNTPSRLYPEMVEAYRQSLINIDMLIIKDLANLFMLCW